MVNRPFTSFPQLFKTATGTNIWSLSLRMSAVIWSRLITRVSTVKMNRPGLMQLKRGLNGSEHNLHLACEGLTSSRSGWQLLDSLLIPDILPKQQKTSGRSEPISEFSNARVVKRPFSAFARIENHYFINEVPPLFIFKATLTFLRASCARVNYWNNSPSTRCPSSLHSAYMTADY